MYRKPLLEEFVIGFKYEVYEDIGWYAYEFGLGNCFRDLCDIHYLIESGMIRVKV